MAGLVRFFLSIVFVDWLVHVCAAEGFRVTFEVETQTGHTSFVVRVHEDWAPLGAARFKQLVERHFFDDSRFFRVIRHDIYQFGVSGSPSVYAGWVDRTIEDDPVKVSNMRGRLAFAQSGPNTRTTQVFINLADDEGNQDLDREGFAPFAELEEGGVEVVAQIFPYGEKPLVGRGWDRIVNEGNAYLDAAYPKMSKILSVYFLGGNGSHSEL